jgi:hypothetical protein
MATTPKTSDAAILAKMKVDAPWLYATYTSPAFTSSQKKVFMGWARAAAAGKPVTPQQMAAQTYKWPITQLWNASQQQRFQESFNNPGQYKSELASTQVNIDSLIKAKGLTVDAATRDKAVNKVFLEGMSMTDPRVIQLLTDTYKYPATTTDGVSPTSGQASTAMADISRIFSQYGIAVPKDPAVLSGYIKGIIGPNGTTQTATDYAKAQALQLYPWMTGSLDAGGTVEGYLSPYTANIAATLGISPASINWSDPKWQGVVASKDANGLSVPQTLDQSLQTIKSDPRFGYTQTATAKNDAYTALNAIGQMFGNQG